MLSANDQAVSEQAGACRWTGYWRLLKSRTSSSPKSANGPISSGRNTTSSRMNKMRCLSSDPKCLRTSRN